MKRFFKKLLIICIVVFGIVAPLTYIGGTSSWFLCRIALPAVSYWTKTDLRAAHAKLSLISREVEFDGLTISRGEIPLFESHRTYAAFSLRKLLFGELYLYDVQLDTPHVRIVKDAENIWNFSHGPGGSEYELPKLEIRPPAPMELPFDLRLASIRNGTVEVRSGRGDELRFDHLSFTLRRGENAGFAGQLKGLLSYRNPFDTKFLRQPMRLSFSGTREKRRRFPAQLSVDLTIAPLNGVAAGHALDSQVVHAKLAAEAVDTGVRLDYFSFDIARQGGGEVSRFNSSGFLASEPDSRSSIHLHAERLSSDALHFLSSFIAPKARWDNTEIVYDGILASRGLTRFTLAGTLSAKKIMFRPWGKRPIFPEPTEAEIQHHMVWERGKPGFLGRFDACVSIDGDPLLVAKAERYVGFRLNEIQPGDYRLAFYRPDGNTQPNPELLLQLNNMPLKLLQPWIITNDSVPHLFESGTLGGTLKGEIREKTVVLTGKGEFRGVATHHDRLYHAPLDFSLRLNGEMFDNNDFDLSCYALSLMGTGRPVADMELTCSYKFGEARMGGTYGITTYPVQLHSLVPPLAENPLFESWISKPLLENATLSLKGTYAIGQRNLRTVTTRALMVSGQTLLAHGDIEIFPVTGEPQSQPFTADIFLAPQFLYALLPPPDTNSRSSTHTNIHNYLETHDIRLGANGAFIFADSALLFNAADLILQPQDSALAPFPTKLTLTQPIRIAQNTPLPQIDFAASGYDRAQYVIDFLGPDDAIKQRIEAAAGHDAMLRWRTTGAFAKEMLDFSLTEGSAELLQGERRTLDITLGEPLVIPIRTRRFPAVLSLFVQGSLPADSGYVFIPKTETLMPKGGELSVDGSLELRLEDMYLNIRSKGHIDSVTLPPSPHAYQAALAVDLGIHLRERHLHFRTCEAAFYPANDSNCRFHAFMSPSTLYWREKMRSSPLIFNYTTDSDFPLQRYLVSQGRQPHPMTHFKSQGSVTAQFISDTVTTLQIKADADSVQSFRHGSHPTPFAVKLRQKFDIENDYVSIRDHSLQLFDSKRDDLTLDLRAQGKLARARGPHQSTLELRIEQADLPRLKHYFQGSDTEGLFDLPRGLGLDTELPSLDLAGIRAAVDFNFRRIRLADDSRHYTFSGKFNIGHRLCTLENLLISDGSGTARGTLAFNPSAADGYPFHATLKATAFNLFWKALNAQTQPAATMVDTLEMNVRGKGFSAKNLKRHGEGILVASMTNLRIPFATENVWMRLITLPVGLSLTLNPVEEITRLFNDKPRILEFENGAACITLNAGAINLDRIRLRNGSPISEILLLGKIDPATAALIHLNAAVKLNQLTILSFAADGSLYDPKYNPLSSAGRTIVDNVGNVINLPDLFNRINPFGNNSEKPLTDAQETLLERLRTPPPQLQH